MDSTEKDGWDASCIYPFSCDCVNSPNNELGGEEGFASEACPVHNEWTFPCEGCPAQRH